MNLDDCLDEALGIGCCGGVSEGNPQTSRSQIHGVTHRNQYVRGPQNPCLAGASRLDAYSLLVQQKKQIVALGSRKNQVGVVLDTLSIAGGNHCARYSPENFGLDEVSKLF